MKRTLLGLLALVAVIALVAVYRDHRKKTADNAFEQNFINEYGVTDAEADKAIRDARNEGFD